MVSRGIPLEGIGLQMHISVDGYPAPSDVAANMKRLGELGLKVHITEMDVRCSNCNAQRLDIQAQIYGGMMEACLNNTGVCQSYETWGVSAGAVAGGCLALLEPGIRRRHRLQPHQRVDATILPALSLPPVSPTLSLSPSSLPNFLSRRSRISTPGSGTLRIPPTRMSCPSSLTSSTTPSPRTTSCSRSSRASKRGVEKSGDGSPVVGGGAPAGLGDPRRSGASLWVRE
jgi:hypothetical protein